MPRVSSPQLQFKMKWNKECFSNWMNTMTTKMGSRYHESKAIVRSLDRTFIFYVLFWSQMCSSTNEEKKRRTFHISYISHYTWSLFSMRAELQKKKRNKIRTHLELYKLFMKCQSNSKSDSFRWVFQKWNFRSFERF